MSINKRAPVYGGGKIITVETRQIYVPEGRRRCDGGESMDRLIKSVARYGILQPLSLRRREDGKFELVSGTRRLYAAKRAGLREVPCVVLDLSSPEGELYALTENLQRRDLDFLEEAKQLYRLVHLHGFKQEEAARRTGRSQSAVANKLRLLRIPEEILEKLRDAGLSERHARELLRLYGREEMAEAADEMVKKQMTALQAQEFVTELLKPDRHQTVKLGRMDPEFLVNTVERAVDTMRKSGVLVEVKREKEEEREKITIIIPHAGKATSASKE